MNRTKLAAFHLCSVGILCSSRVALAQAVAPPAPSSATTSALDQYVSNLLPNVPGRFGLGLSIGNMVTGVTAKLWAASSVAFQATIGEGAAGNDLRTHLDLLFSPATWTSSDGKYILPLYVGVGGSLWHNFAGGQVPSYTEGGFRVPFGMSALIRGNPVELFFEIAPEFTVRSSSMPGKYGVYADGSVGARYYF